MAPSSLEDEFAGTKEVDAAVAFDANVLTDYLSAVIEGFAGPLQLRQFKGGQSNPTYLMETPGCNYVLRRKPPGKLLPSAHAVDREFRVISALYSMDFPVPEPFHLCEDDTVIGTAFYVMSHVAGRVFWTPDMEGLAADERSAVYDSMNETIARLHQVDYANQQLSNFGKEGNYFARQISRWSKQYRTSEIEFLAEMNKLMEWLPANIPESETTTLVHGDFRLDNMIVHPTEPRVIAVLDWELSTLGDPLADFSYHLMPWRAPDLGPPVSTLVGHDLKSLGIPDEEAYIKAYCARTGRDGIENLDFYFAYNFFRIAAILQGIAGRVRDGTATSPHAKRLTQGLIPLAQTAWAFAQKAGAA